MKSIVAHDFNLDHTLECGQFFRYHKHNGIYYVSHRARLFKIQQKGTKLFYQNCTKQFLTDFFRLDDDYKTITKSISKDAHIRNAIKSLYGLRIIRQDPWECLISYLCSSNANIPKIKMNLRLLAQEYGSKIALDEFSSYTFPKPGELTNLKKLNRCKVGFRAKYIEKVNNKIEYKTLKKMRNMDYLNAKEELIRLPGVGDKIADCVLLFSLDKLNAFPVDVWVQRVVQELYFKKKKVTKAQVREFGQSYFGEYAGYANQFLFYYRRMQG